jgi:arginine decarboxylase
MDARSQHRRIDKFFSGPGARADDWRDLLEAAKG